MVKYLVKKMGADVNYKLLLDLNLSEKVECPVFAVSIARHLDPDILKLLVEEFGADINAEVKIGNQSASLLHLAICLIKE
jgi:hypothetical protein